SDKDTYDESRICQTLIVTPAEPGDYLLLIYFTPFIGLNYDTNERSGSFRILIIKPQPWL
ncbi:MAG: hypothetical protein KZQ57_12935, partial [gamma proteobacterium symbiont of Lucinoma myriamae]|nr:hypothetical protein [gamma proteobacterium symbiont of Lucinoma myriamae]